MLKYTLTVVDEDFDPGSNKVSVRGRAREAQDLAEACRTAAFLLITINNTANLKDPFEDPSDAQPE